MESQERQLIEDLTKQLRAAKSDTEKFAILMLLSKCVHDVDAREDVLKAAFEAIGLDFLKKLLYSDEVPPGCPVYAYKNLVISMLSVFVLAFPETRKGDTMFECFDGFKNIIACQNDLKERHITIEKNYMDMSEQMLEMLYVILAENKKAQEELKRSGLLAEICKAATYEDATGEHAYKLIVLLAKLGNIYMRDDATSMSIHKLLAIKSKSLYDSVTTRNKDKIDFDFIGQLAEIIYSRRQFTSDDKNGELKPANKWSAVLFQSIKFILSEKSVFGHSAEETGQLLQLVNSCIGIFGLQWAYKHNEKEGQSEGERYKYVHLFANLACVEVVSSLESDDINQVYACIERTVPCYSILETVIMDMVEGKCDYLNAGQITCMVKLMSNPIKSILHFLKNVQRVYNTDAVLIDYMSNVVHHSFLHANFRLLGCWLSENSHDLRDEVYDVLPFLIQLCFCELQAGIQHPHKYAASMLTLIMPAVYIICEDHKAKQILLHDSTYIRLLVKCAQFLMDNRKNQGKGRDSLHLPMPMLHICFTLWSVLNLFFLNSHTKGCAECACYRPDDGLFKLAKTFAKKVSCLEVNKGTQEVIASLSTSAITIITVCVKFQSESPAQIFSEELVPFWKAVMHYIFGAHVVNGGQFCINEVYATCSCGRFNQTQSMTWETVMTSALKLMSYTGGRRLLGFIEQRNLDKTKSLILASKVGCGVHSSGKKCNDLVQAAELYRQLQLNISNGHDG